MSRRPDSSPIRSSLPVCFVDLLRGPILWTRGSPVLTEPRPCWCQPTLIPLLDLDITSLLPMSFSPRYPTFTFQTRGGAVWLSTWSPSSGTSTLSRVSLFNPLFQISNSVPPRSVCGQLAFGYLADRYGRTRLYGIELVLVIVSTIGVATTSTGMGGMSFLALFAWVC